MIAQVCLWAGIRTSHLLTASPVFSLLCFRKWWKEWDVLGYFMPKCLRILIACPQLSHPLYGVPIRYRWTGEIAYEHNSTSCAAEPVQNNRSELLSSKGIFFPLSKHKGKSQAAVMGQPHGSTGRNTEEKRVPEDVWFRTSHSPFVFSPQLHRENHLAPIVSLVLSFTTDQPHSSTGEQDPFCDTDI